MSASRAKKMKMATKSCPECDQQVGAGAGIAGGGAGALGRVAVGGGRWLWRGRLAGVPAAEWRAGCWARRSRGEPGPGRAEPKGGRGNARGRSPAGAHLAAVRRASVRPVAGPRGRGRGLVPESPGRLRVTAAGVCGQRPKWTSTVPPFSPLRPLRGCPMCPTGAQGPGSESPVLSRRVALFPSAIHGGPQKCLHRDLGSRRNVTKGAAMILSFRRIWRFLGVPIIPLLHF